MCFFVAFTFKFESPVALECHRAFVVFRQMISSALEGELQLVTNHAPTSVRKLRMQELTRC